MSSKDDIEAGEKKPLLSHVNTKERAQIEEMEDIGAGNPKFASSLQYAVRTAVWMAIIASIIWVPAIRKPFPNDI